uniref:Chromo domain-containing protein n=1 Tax=Nicotiana tabacum TaxID=4097 RepID=A0A1S3ZF54_TOBAC|nr:PREDICTED: uncharacterized protein LOC107786053 [Nicotiana tabacum]
MKKVVLNNKTLTFSLGGEDGVLRCQGRLCVPNVDNLRGRVMAEAHNSRFHVSIRMAPFDALYGRSCRSPIRWFEVGEAELLGLDLVHQAMEKVKIIQERLKTSQSRQKSYADIHRRKLEFQVDDWVFLRKVVGDPSTIVPIEAIEVNEELSYEEIPVAILDRQVHKLRNKEVSSVKVLWQSQQVEEATWETESEMKEKYPHLFEQVK